MNWRPQKYTQISNALRRYFFKWISYLIVKHAITKLKIKTFINSDTVWQCVNIYIQVLGLLLLYFDIDFRSSMHELSDIRLNEDSSTCFNIAWLQFYQNTQYWQGTQNWNLWHSDQFDHLLPRVTDSSVGRDLSLEIQGA